MYVDRDLVRRVEYSAAEFCVRHAQEQATLTPESDATAQECDGGALIAFGRGRYVNRAMALGLGGTPAHAIVGAITSFYTARSIPPSLEIGPWADAELVAALAHDGFHLERFRNVYVHELTSIPEPSRVDIHPVDENTTIDRMAILSGDAPVGSDARSISDEFCVSAAQVPDTHDFIALADGSPAACGSLNVVDGVGWFGGAATREEQRGRGLQQALLAHRLHLARDLKCEFAACTAVPDGQSARNLERANFQLIYTQAVLVKR